MYVSFWFFKTKTKDFSNRAGTLVIFYRLKSSAAESAEAVVVIVVIIAVVAVVVNRPDFVAGYFGHPDQLDTAGIVIVLEPDSVPQTKRLSAFHLVDSFGNSDRLPDGHGQVFDENWMTQNLIHFVRKPSALSD